MALRWRVKDFLIPILPGSRSRSSSAAWQVRGGGGGIGDAIALMKRCQ